MIDLEWLRTFNAIIECGSLTEASKKLNMTQPGVSKHLSALENHIGKRLFNSTTRKIVATAYAVFLFSQTSQAIKTLEKVEYYSSKHSAKKRFSASIACRNDFYKRYLKNSIYTYDMYINIQFGNDKELIALLENDNVQIVLGLEKYDKTSHKLSLINTDAFILVSSCKSKRAEDLESLQEISKWLMKQIWYVFDHELQDVNRYWNLNFKKQSKLIARYVLPSYLDILESLIHNEGFAILPADICKDALNRGTLINPFQQLKPFYKKNFLSTKLKNKYSDDLNQFKQNILNDINKIS